MRDETRPHNTCTLLTNIVLYSTHIQTHSHKVINENQKANVFLQQHHTALTVVQLVTINVTDLRQTARQDVVCSLI